MPQREVEYTMASASTVAVQCHTGEYLSEIFLETIEEIVLSKVLTVITDSASAMIKSRRLIDDKYPHISVYSCVAYNLNSLVGDIMKVSTIKSISDIVKGIVKEVNSSHLSKATFNEIQDDIVRTDKTKKAKKVSLKFPGNTRCGSILFNAESLLYNKKALKRLAITYEVILRHDIHTSILDENFWCGLLSIF